MSKSKIRDSFSLSFEYFHKLTADCIVYMYSVLHCYKASNRFISEGNIWDSAEDCLTAQVDFIEQQQFSLLWVTVYVFHCWYLANANLVTGRDAYHLAK